MAVKRIKIHLIAQPKIQMYQKLKKTLNMLFEVACRRFCLHLPNTKMIFETLCNIINA